MLAIKKKTAAPKFSDNYTSANTQEMLASIVASNKKHSKMMSKLSK